MSLRPGVQHAPSIVIKHAKVRILLLLLLLGESKLGEAQLVEDLGGTPDPPQPGNMHHHDLLALVPQHPHMLRLLLQGRLVLAVLAQEHVGVNLGEPVAPVVKLRLEDVVGELRQTLLGGRLLPLVLSLCPAQVLGWDSMATHAIIALVVVVVAGYLEKKKKKKGLMASHTKSQIKIQDSRFKGRDAEEVKKGGDRRR